MKEIAERLNNGVEIDWDNKGQKKYSLLFSTVSHNVTLYNHVYAQLATIYCLDEDFKDVAIKEIGKNRLINYLKKGL